MGNRAVIVEARNLVERKQDSTNTEIRLDRSCLAQVRGQRSYTYTMPPCVGTGDKLAYLSHHVYQEQHQSERRAPYPHDLANSWVRGCNSSRLTGRLSDTFSYGYRESDFWNAIVEHRAHAVIVDAGSTDGGPSCIGLDDEYICAKDSYIRDFGPMLDACHHLGVKILISSAGGCG